jgi:hypothetical protein
MSKCHCGGSNPNSITCEFGCGCIANADGSDCHCACADANGGIEMDFSITRLGLDTPILLCLHDVDPSSLADGLANHFAPRLTSRTVKRVGRVTRERSETTLRKLGHEIGLTFS